MASPNAGVAGGFASARFSSSTASRRRSASDDRWLACCAATGKSDARPSQSTVSVRRAHTSGSSSGADPLQQLEADRVCRVALEQAFEHLRTFLALAAFEIDAA